MKIRKLVAQTEVSCGEVNISETCTVSGQRDYEDAIQCIQSAISFLSHTVQCNKEDVVAKESIGNLAVVLLDLKSACSDCDAPESAAVEDIITE